MKIITLTNGQQIINLRKIDFYYKLAAETENIWIVEETENEPLNPKLSYIKNNELSKFITDFLEK